MAFWDRFITINDQSSDNRNTLLSKIKSLLPNKSDKQYQIITCVAGLLARVAYTDFTIDPGEEESMKVALKTWTNLNNEDVDAIVKISLDEIKNLAGLENHLYTSALHEHLSKDERYQLLESLFAVAAADGNVENQESEEIRLIATGLRLSHQHFISARATVLDKLGALK